MTRPRRDLRRRRPLFVHIEEEHDVDNDDYGVVAYFTRADGTIATAGGYVHGWSTLTDDVRAKVRADLRAIAEREVRAGATPQVVHDA